MLFPCCECGTLISSKANECPNCGAPRHIAFRTLPPQSQPISHPQPIPPPQPASTAVVQPSGLSRWEIILGGGAIFSILLGLVLIFCSLQY